MNTKWNLSMLIASYIYVYINTVDGSNEKGFN